MMYLAIGRKITAQILKKDLFQKDSVRNFCEQQEYVDRARQSPKSFQSTVSCLLGFKQHELKRHNLLYR